MSEDPGAVEAPQNEAPASGRRGRPRPQTTVDRDEKVRALLTERGALTRSAIAEALGWESKEAYASLWRLRHYEQAVEKVAGKSEWQLVGATPAPPTE